MQLDALLCRSDVSQIERGHVRARAHRLSTASRRNGGVGSWWMAWRLSACLALELVTNLFPLTKIFRLLGVFEI